MENNFNSEGLWLFAILALFGGGFGGFGNNYNRGGEQLATTSEVRDGFYQSDTSQQIRGITYGLSDLGYALMNAITGEGRGIQMQIADAHCKSQANTDAIRYEMANFAAATNANVTAQIQGLKDIIAQNKIDSLATQVSDLKMQNMFCGVPKINPYFYGVYPYAVNNGGCGGCGYANNAI